MLNVCFSKEGHRSVRRLISWSADRPATLNLIRKTFPSSPVESLTENKNIFGRINFIEKLWDFFSNSGRQQQQNHSVHDNSFVWPTTVENDPSHSCFFGPNLSTCSLFLLISRYKFNTKFHYKRVDDVPGIWTRARRMVGVDESTELRFITQG